MFKGDASAGVTLRCGSVSKTSAGQGEFCTLKRADRKVLIHLHKRDLPVHRCIVDNRCSVDRVCIRPLCRCSLSIRIGLSGVLILLQCDMTSFVYNDPVRLIIQDVIRVRRLLPESIGALLDILDLYQSVLVGCGRLCDVIAVIRCPAQHENSVGNPVQGIICCSLLSRLVEGEIAMNPGIVVYRKPNRQVLRVICSTGGILQCLGNRLAGVILCLWIGDPELTLIIDFHRIGRVVRQPVGVGAVLHEGIGALLNLCNLLNLCKGQFALCIRRLRFVHGCAVVGCAGQTELDIADRLMVWLRALLQQVDIPADDELRRYIVLLSDAVAPAGIRDAVVPHTHGVVCLRIALCTTLSGSTCRCLHVEVCRNCLELAKGIVRLPIRCLVEVNDDGCDSLPIGSVCFRNGKSLRSVQRLPLAEIQL